MEAGYSEETTAAVLKEKGYKELVALLKDSKILVLDFCSWVKDELAKIPAKPRGRVAGSGTDRKTGSSTPRDIQALVGMLSDIKDVSPADASEMLKTLVNDEAKMEKAVSILIQKELENGRKKGHILLRVRTAGGSKIKPKK
jgi:hypothetical protein